MLRKILFLFITASLLLASCARSTESTPTGAPISSASSALPPTAASPTQKFTPEPTPSPNLVILAGVDAPSLELQTAVETLATESGWQVETRPTLDAASLPPGTRVIFWLGDPSQARPLADAVPQVQVIAFNPQPGEPTANLTWLVQNSYLQAFAAGYLTMLVTEDWRAGGLLPAEPAALMEAFLNGGRYLCGRCIPLYAPIVEFPVAAAVPAGQDGLSALESLNTQYGLDTTFIHPLVSTGEGLNQFSGQEIIYIGLETPPDALRDRWAASITFDLPAALRQAWPQGETSGAVIQIPLIVQDVNAEILTEGKMRLLQQVLQDLQVGLIFPLSIAP